MLDPFSFVSEVVIAATGFTIFALTMRKEAKTIAHNLLAFALFLVGVYGTSIVIYDLTPEFTTDTTIIDGVIGFFVRFGIVTLFFGVIFLFFTFQVIVHTKDWLTFKNTLPFLIGVGIYGVVFFAWSEAVTIVEYGNVPVNSKIDTYMVIILGVSVLLTVLMTMYNLYKFGIKPSEGDKRRKMAITFSGFCLALVALVFNLASNMVSEGGTLFDSLYFLTLAVAMIFVAYGFIGPARK